MRNLYQIHALCSDLHNLTGNKANWKWTNNEESCFQKVKSILSSNDTMIPYNKSKVVVLACDASEDGLGAS